MIKLPEVPVTLKRSIVDDKLVVFAGAGVSSGLGFPLWDQLIISMLRDISEEDSKYSGLIPLYEDGVMTTFEVLNKVEEFKRVYRSKLEDTFSIEINDRSQLIVHEKINLLSKKIITTNYDFAFEKAIGVRPITNDIKKIADLYNMSSFLYKIHGTADNPNSCILTETDYEKLYLSESPQIEALKHLSLSNNFLFVGFSMNDEYIKNIFSKLNKIFLSYGKKGYLLTTNENIDLREENIQTLLIENYNDVVPFIDMLLECKNVVVDEEVLESEILEIDENELRDFVIEFNSEYVEKKVRKKRDISEVELQKKFADMICNETFTKAFDTHSVYFDPIDEIMNSPIYVSSSNREVIIDIVIEYYQSSFNEKSDGTSIYNGMIDEMMDEGLQQISLSNRKKRIFLKILVSWAIYNCNIYNEKLTGGA